MPTDLEIIKQLESEIGSEFREVEFCDFRTSENGFKTDADQNVVSLCIFSAGLSALPPEIGQLQNLLNYICPVIN